MPPLIGQHQPTGLLVAQRGRLELTTVRRNLPKQKAYHYSNEDYLCAVIEVFCKLIAKEETRLGLVDYATVLKLQPDLLCSFVKSE
jgi:hypothetical protein